jgi:uncharacterized protein
MPILVILLIVLVIVFVAGYSMYHTAFFPKRYSFEEVVQGEIKQGKINGMNEFNGWPKEEIHIISPFGYTLNGFYFPLKDVRKTIVLSHGITVNRYCSIKYMALFRQRGFNILAYDNRFHGSSEGAFCSFGYFEKQDLKTVVDWVFQRNGPDAIIGTHGESLGAAITLQHAAIDPRIRFAIADCSWSDLKQLFTLRLQKDFHLPAFPLLDLTRFYAKILLKFDYLAASPIQYLKDIQTPIFFVHGDKDTYILPQMSVEMFDAKTQGIRRLYLAPGAGHAEAYSVNPTEYGQQMDSFFKQIGV